MSKDKPKTLQESIAALGDLKSHIDLYRIGKEDESTDVPGALVVDSERLNALRVLLMHAEAEFKGEFNFIAITQYGWGADPNPVEAIRKAKSNSPRGKKTTIRLYRAHKDTEMHGDGSWTYPQEFAPVFIAE